MATSPTDLARLEADFLSGRNPLAYIPYCQALRRAKRFARALEACVEGLARDRDSIAGRTLYCRILGDLGLFGEALTEIDRALQQAPESAGLQTEKVRCLIKLARYDEAEEALRELNRRNPMDATVQHLNSQFREYRTKKEAATSSSAPRSPGAAYLSTREISDRLVAAVSAVAAVHAAAVIPLDAGEPAVVGAVENAEAALVFCQEVGMACIELDTGRLNTGIIESERRLLFIAQRDRLVVCLAVDVQAQLGKVLHRFQLFLKQIFREDGSQLSNASMERVAKL